MARIDRDYRVSTLGDTSMQNDLYSAAQEVAILPWLEEIHPKGSMRALRLQMEKGSTVDGRGSLRNSIHSTMIRVCPVVARPLQCLGHKKPNITRLSGVRNTNTQSINVPCRFGIVCLFRCSLRVTEILSRDPAALDALLQHLSERKFHDINIEYNAFQNFRANLPT